MTAASTAVPDVVAGIVAARERLTGNGPVPGRAWCRAWTAEIDRALVALYDATPAPGQWCLAAVGGYGREELCPGSDVDLLVLHDGWDDEALAVLVRSVVYPLWDAGLKVGYALRTRRQAVAATDDLDAATAIYDARTVAGSKDLLTTTVAAAVTRIRRKPARLLSALSAADAERRARVGPSAELLEPDLKNGAGGLRDVQSLRWAGGALVGTVGLDPLVAAGYLGAPDRSRLARAYDTLLAERVATHLAAGHAADTLTFELQAAVARRLGFRDGHRDTDTAAHRLLTQHFLAARVVAHVHGRAWPLIAADATAGRRRRRPAQERVDGFEIVDGVLRLPSGADLDDPSLPFALLDTMSRTETVLERGSATALRSRVATGDVGWRWDDTTRTRFLRVLWRGNAALAPVAELDDAGVVVALIPEWEPLRGRAQRNPFHRYGLDRHAWHAAAELAELVAHEPWAATTLERVEDREALMLGALLHDVGKAHGEPHAETGQDAAAAICRRLKCRPATVATVRRLVGLHLVLPDVATRRDLTDPTLIEHVAGQIGDHALLASLHLLAAADAMATGPSAWSTWKASLIRTLVVKVAAVLNEKHPDDIGDGAAATATRAQELAAEMGATSDLVRAHLAGLPRHYAAALAPRAVVRHALMAATPPRPGEVRTRVTPGPERADGLDAYDEVDVVALDAPGMFAKVAGVLSLNGGLIVGASAFARADRTAVDTFTVVKPDGAPLSWWARVEGDIAEAVAGKLALRARVAMRARQEQRRLDKLPDVETAVSVAPDEAGAASIVEVHTADRVGVLFAITEALAELQLDIVVARIQTLGHEVVDVFTVRDAAGGPLDDHHAAEVELAVAHGLESLGQ